uniref:Uncharacterized protein n=1 Tax=Rhizophora mucronata TaxID=61149 RepID=A0A2P2LI83_RHIMU
MIPHNSQPRKGRSAVRPINAFMLGGGSKLHEIRLLKCRKTKVHQPSFSHQAVFTLRDGGRRNKLIRSSSPLVVITRKLKSTIKYDPSTRSNSKSNVTLAT